jgi:cation diffusion facilitator family transporter
VKLERWGWASIAVNVALAALHASIASTSGSLAVTAELMHNLVDLTAAVAVLVGLRLSTRKTQTFPYGLHKLENLVAAGLAVLVFVSAFEIARAALQGRPEAMRVDAWMLAALVAGAALPLVFSHYELRAGVAANSPALIADAREYRVHALTAGLAFAALAAEWLDFPIDRFAALFIAVAVVKTGWDLLRDAMRVLLDASLDAPTLLEIRTRIESDPAVSAVGWVTGRSAGRLRFVETGVALRVTELERIENVVRRIETAVRAAVPYVERVLVHVEAPASAVVRHTVPLADPSGTVSEHFGSAPWFALVTVRRADGAVEEQRIVANPHANEERAKGIRVAEWLVGHKVDVVFSREPLHGKGPGYALQDAGVELRLTQEGSLAAVLAGGVPPGSAPDSRA